MKIKRKGKKGENGRVLIVGGSKDYVGAPALAALAALYTGVDLVTVCAPEQVAWTINTFSPDLITKKLLGEELGLTHTKKIIEESEKCDVVILGNGLGLKKEFVMKLLREIKKPFVIDADALKVITLDAVSNSILTPHSKEFEILFKNTLKRVTFDELDMSININKIKKNLGNNIMLLKGEKDTIFTKHRSHINKTGNDSMTVGGTGDILAGLCGGYLAQSKNLFESGKEAAGVNGKLGDYMYKQKGYSYSAYEMVNELWRFTK